jgi:hypothetical protein
MAPYPGSAVPRIVSTRFVICQPHRPFLGQNRAKSRSAFGRFGPLGATAIAYTPQLPAAARNTVSDQSSGRRGVAVA